MKPIRKIKIEGFRGILASLPLDFIRGNQPTSMALFGTNGTGKSSITDAWEWFHTGKIYHLRREGAKESSFPNVNAQPGHSFIEVEFSDSSLGTVRLEFDHDRVTMPVASGELERFRTLARHPCHIRYGDLTRFVYLTKADRFDALAALMGVMPQVELQKGLRRVERQLDDELNKKQNQQNQFESQLANAVGIDKFDEDKIWAFINNALKEHGVKVVESYTELVNAQAVMTKLVEDDPRAKESVDLHVVIDTLSDAEIDIRLAQSVTSYIDSLKGLVDQAVEAVDVMLLQLFEKGKEVVDFKRKQGEEITTCPLCGKTLDADLDKHIKDELQRLNKIRDIRQRVKDHRKKIQDLIPDENSLSAAIGNLWADNEKQRAKWNLDDLSSKAKTLDKTIAKINELIEMDFYGATVEIISGLDEIVKRLADDSEKFEDSRKRLEVKIRDKIADLEIDESRTLLVKSHTTLTNIVNVWPDCQKAKEAANNLNQVLGKYKAIAENFVTSSIQHISTRFDAISSDVQTYFNILEEHNEVLSNPSLKVLPDQERALVLEIEFQGERVAPAYKYLSESQLNSFGISVFLASAKHINSDFRFLILDDVINSFDAYKRPQIIRLLKEHFGDFQVLVLTHDDIWRNRLFEECSSWTRLRFKRYEAGVGPIRDRGLMEIEEIEQLLLDGKPVRAAQAMGPFLERQLQSICESFEVLVKYNQRNEYTLDPLLVRWRARIKEKLGAEHPVYIAIEELISDTGFRNFTAHWKEPTSHITVPEMRSTVEKWKAIEQQIRCGKPTCHGYPRYDGANAFICTCGTLKLTSNMQAEH